MPTGGGGIRTPVDIRQRIYSPPRLAASVPLRNATFSQRPDSNWQPTDYKSVALPIELRWQLKPNTAIVPEGRFAVKIRSEAGLLPFSCPQCEKGRQRSSKCPERRVRRSCNSEAPHPKGEGGAFKFYSRKKAFFLLKRGFSVKRRLTPFSHPPEKK